MPHFSELFERPAPWPAGPALLAEVAAHLRGRAPVLILNPLTPAVAELVLPVPCRRDPATGWHHSVVEHLPPAALVPFAQACGRVVQEWSGGPGVRDALTRRLPGPVTGYVLDGINADLAAIEHQVREQDLGPQLWEIAADHFGLAREAIPAA